MLAVLAGLLAALLLAAAATHDNGLPGLGRGRLIFVGPDEAGRVETLSVREGDTVETGDAAVHAR